MTGKFYMLDATAQAELVRRGEVHPAELVDAAIERIERLNPHVNAVIVPLFEKARAQAASPNLPDGPFRGVPMLLNDLICHTAGDPYYEGMRFLRDLDWREESDTYLAAKFRAAGFIFLGKTNIPELGLLPITEPAAFGPTHNPWDTARSPGGSSGGSAVAVACGMVPVAHGNDGTGSIRGPASACGLVGLKPSRGRISIGPGRTSGLLGNITEHVLTRSVRDTAAVLDAIMGPMPGDMFVAPPPKWPYSKEVGADPGQLRVGLLLHDPFLESPVHPECLAAVRETGKLLESLGHAVEESSPPALGGPSGLGPAFLGRIAASGVASALEYWSEHTGRAIGPEDVEPHTWQLAEKGRSVSGTQIHAAIRRLAKGIMRVPEWWASGFDLLVTPTLAQLPPRTGEVPLDRLGEVFGLFTMPFNFTGQPAISLPIYWAEDGETGATLPVGVQLVADYGREDLLIRVSSQLEAARPWANRLPPLEEL